MCVSVCTRARAFMYVFFKTPILSILIVGFVKMKAILNFLVYRLYICEIIPEFSGSLDRKVNSF